MITRRRLLRATAATGLGGLAGCLGGGGGGGGDGGDTVDTLSVAGSPGEPVPVAPDRVTLLDFFATWCPPCKPQMAELRAVEERVPDAHLLSVTNEGDADAVRSFWREFEGTWPVALDPDLELSSRFQAGRVPTMIVLDPAGEERWRHSGLARADTVAAELEAAGATPS